MTKAASKRLPLGQALAFALPGLPIAWLIPPIYAILGDFYLRYSAATAAGVGTAMILSKVVDAVTDPPVGYLSDHTKTAMGARKPWIIAGTLLSMLCFFVLFNPPEDAGSLYFTAGIILYYLSYTLIKIPYRAWLGEISQSYGERSQLWSFFTIGLLLGGVVIMLLPVVLSLPAISLFDSAEFDRDMMSMIGWVGIVLMPLCISIALIFAPAGQKNPGNPPSLKTFIAPIISCRPFQTFMVGYGLSALGFGVLYSVIIVALSSYFRIADRIPLFLLFMIGIQVVSIPLWERLGKRFSKHNIWAWAWLLHAGVGPAIFFIDPSHAPFWPLVVFGALTSILQAPHMLFPVSIINDIVDYDTLRTGHSRAGNFMSVFTFIDKGLHAVGFGIGYYLLALFGYDAKAATHDSWAVIGLMTALIVVPGMCFAAAGFVLFRFPINARKHKIIRRRLQKYTHNSWEEST